MHWLHSKATGAEIKILHIRKSCSRCKKTFGFFWCFSHLTIDLIETPSKWHHWDFCAFRSGSLSEMISQRGMHWHLLHSSLWQTTAHHRVSACTAALPSAERCWNIWTRQQPPYVHWYWKYRPGSWSVCHSHTLQSTEHRDTPTGAVCT